MVKIVNQSNFKKISTDFYEGEVISVKDVILIDGWLVMFVTWRSPEIPFDVKKMIKCRPENDYFLDKVFKAAGLTGVKGEDDSIEYREQDLVGTKLLALCYQDDYVNIFDFLPMDASIEVQNKAKAKYDAYMNKVANKDSGKTVKVDDNDEKKNDLPF